MKKAHAWVLKEIRDIIENEEISAVPGNFKIIFPYRILWDRGNALKARNQLEDCMTEQKQASWKAQCRDSLALSALWTPL